MNVVEFCAVDCEAITCMGIAASQILFRDRLHYQPGTFVAHYAGWEPSAERYDRIVADLAQPEASPTA